MAARLFSMISSAVWDEAVDAQASTRATTAKRRMDVLIPRY
jgi:hypothetical protein